MMRLLEIVNQLIWGAREAMPLPDKPDKELLADTLRSAFIGYLKIRSHDLKALLLGADDAYIKARYNSLPSARAKEREYKIYSSLVDISNDILEVGLPQDDKFSGKLYILCLTSATESVYDSITKGEFHQSISAALPAIDVCRSNCHDDTVYETLQLNPSHQHYDKLLKLRVQLLLVPEKPSCSV